MKWQHHAGLAVLSLVVTLALMALVSKIGLPAEDRPWAGIACGLIGGLIWCLVEIWLLDKTL